MWDAIKLYMSKLWSVIKPSVMILLSEVGQMAMSIAVDIVKDLATQDLSSSEKREAAFDGVKEQLEASGKTAGNSLINLVIELAVQALKAEK